MVEILSFMELASSIIWLALGLVIVWAVWRILQIVDNYADFIRDKIAYSRGLLAAHAKEVGGIEFIYESKQPKTTKELNLTSDEKLEKELKEKRAKKRK